MKNLKKKLLLFEVEHSLNEVFLLFIVKIHIFLNKIESLMIFIYFWFIWKYDGPIENPV